jgi:hypothetical protein
MLFPGEKFVVIPTAGKGWAYAMELAGPHHVKNHI